MPRYETVDLLGVGEPDLSIDISKGRGLFHSLHEAPNYGTDFCVKPPMSDQESWELSDSLLNGTTVLLGKVLTQRVAEADATLHNADGEPSDEHFETGVRLAKGLMEIRGLKSARVTAQLGENSRSHLLISQDTISSY
jgi:hypothetical protein